MLDDDAFQWFQDHGGLTRANGDRFRAMVLSRGNTEDLATMYERWLGGAPKIDPMLKYRGLEKTASKNLRGATAKKTNTGVLRFAQNDDFK